MALRARASAVLAHVMARTADVLGAGARAQGSHFHATTLATALRSKALPAAAAACAAQKRAQVPQRAPAPEHCGRQQVAGCSRLHTGGTSTLNTGDITPAVPHWVVASVTDAFSAASKAQDAAFSAALTAKDELIAAAVEDKKVALEDKKQAVAMQLEERKELKAKDKALAKARAEELKARAEERKAKSAELKAKSAELKAKDAVHKLEMQLRDVEPRQEKMFVRFVFEHVANMVRAEMQNHQLTLKDALLTFADQTNADQDRIFQTVKKWYPPAQHEAVYTAYKVLVVSANLSHHDDVLLELLQTHPEVVFHNNLQRLSFRAVCELNDVQLPPPLSDKLVP